MGRLSCTLFDRIQPYVKLGVSYIDMNWIETNESIKAEGGRASAWGVGFNAYLWEFKGLGLKIFSTASFRVTKPRLRSVENKTSVINKKFEIFERQATLGMSKKFDISSSEQFSIVPYAGAVLSDTTAIVRFVDGRRTYNAGATGQEENFGLFFGSDFIFLDTFSLNVEARILDQESLSLGFTTLF